MMVFSWWRKRRRQEIRSQPFPAEWLAYLQRNVGHYRLLPAAQQPRLRELVHVFIAEKHWEGCGGLTITDEIKVTISGAACLLLLGLEHDYYERVRTILVYPTAFLARSQPQSGGTVLEEEVARTGEAHYRGPVILSWEDVLWEGRHPRQSHNLVFHEFAHQLDMEDGSVNGTPKVQDPALARRWHDVMAAEYQALVAAAEADAPTLLDPYGATSEAEFFAVVTECFFGRPPALARRHPELYSLLRCYYGQDPALWTAPA